MSKLDLLHPIIREKADKFLAKCEEEGLEVTIYSTLRTFEEQEKLYAQGRTAPGSIITNSQPGQSWHNYGLAFDAAPVISGKIDWNNEELFKKMAEIGKSIGLTWGGDFKNLKDMPHFEHHPYLTLQQALEKHTKGEKLYPDIIPPKRGPSALFSTILEILLKVVLKK